MSSRKDRRMLRSSLSRARDFGSLSTRAQLLYVLLVLNADDQGRLQAAPDIIKLDVCPRVPDITMEAIPELLQWWEEQRSLQWAYPSDYPPPDVWDDCLRFRQGGNVITLNWPSSSDGATSVPLSDLAERFSRHPQRRSLAIALRKALGEPLPERSPMASGSYIPEPTPEPLAKDTPNSLPEPLGDDTPDLSPKPLTMDIPEPSPERTGMALPKALPIATRRREKGEGKEEEQEDDSVSSLRSETGGSQALPPLGTLSASFQGWLEKLKTARNGRDTIGVLGEFAVAQYSRVPPGLQEVCQQVGQILKSTGIEPEHLLELMWRAAAGPQRQDFLTYVRGAIRKEEQRGRLRKAGRDTEEADGWAGWTVIGDDEGGEQDL
ncbi:MAG: hypothetical protein Q7K03_07225 [Dehalococcoidia bacterium]|nr:hypothetical protein [Dehalococcoidia bacterium]